MRQVAELVVGVTQCVALLLTLTLSAALMRAHQRQWTEPAAQAHVVRVLLLLPISVLLTSAAVLTPQWAVYLDAAQGLYGAFALHALMALLEQLFHERAPHTLDGGIEVGAVPQRDKCAVDEAYVARQNEALFALCAREQAEFGALRLLGCCVRQLVVRAELLQDLRHLVAQYTVVRFGAAVVAVVMHLFGGGDSTGPLYVFGSPAPGHVFLWTDLFCIGSLLGASAALSLFVHVARPTLGGRLAGLKIALTFSVVALPLVLPLLLAGLDAVHALPHYYFAAWSPLTLVVLQACAQSVALVVLALYAWWVFAPPPTQ